MAVGKQDSTASCKKYGIPLYCISWIPMDKIHSLNLQKARGESNEKENEEHSHGSPSSTRYLILGGGGGEGRSGLPNAILVVQYDFTTASLSNDPVDKLGTGEDLPYRLAVHPGGGGVVCSFPSSCKWFEWDVREGTAPRMPALKSSEKLLSQFSKQQVALAFNLDGSMLAGGSEDHCLSVFKWPIMDVVFREFGSPEAVKDLDFSSDGKYLAWLGHKGTGRLWDLNLAKAARNLPRENDEMFRFCCFSRSSNSNLLYIISAKGRGGGIVLWDCSSGRRVGSKLLVRDSISAFNMSADGKLFAIGTVEGDIVIVSCARMAVLMKVKKAHFGIVTALSFSEDSRVVASVSMDSSARVTKIEKREGGANLMAVFIIILAALIVYLVSGNEVIIRLCPHIKKTPPIS